MWYLESLAPIIQKLPKEEQDSAHKFMRQVFLIFAEGIIMNKPELEFYYGVIEKLHKQFAKIEPNNLSFELFAYYLIMFATIYAKQSEERPIGNRYIFYSLKFLLDQYKFKPLSQLQQFNKSEVNVLRELKYHTMVEIPYVEKVAEVPDPDSYLADLIFINQDPFLLYTAIKAKIFAPNVNIAIIETLEPYKLSYVCSGIDQEFDELLIILKAIPVKKTPAIVKNLLLTAAKQLGITVDKHKFEDINTLRNRGYNARIVTSSNRIQASNILFECETPYSAYYCQTKIFQVIQNIFQKKNERCLADERIFYRGRTSVPMQQNIQSSFSDLSIKDTRKNNRYTLFPPGLAVPPQALLPTTPTAIPSSSMKK